MELISSKKDARRIEELETRLAEAEQLIDAIKAGEVDAFALNRDNQPEIFTLQSGDYAYRVLVENFSEGALNLSEDGLIVYTNTAFHELIGLSYEKVISHSVFDFIHPDSVDDFKMVFSKGLAGQARGEINLIAGERIVPVYISLTSLYPTLPTVGMIVTDLSEKKKQQEFLEQQNKELDHSRNFITNVLKSTNHGVFSYQAIRKNGVITDFEVKYANEIALHHLDLPAEEVIGNTYLNIMPDAKKLALFQRIERVLTTGVSETHDVISPTFPDVHFKAYFTPLGDGVTVTFVDISGEVLHAKELEEKNTELQQQKDFIETIIDTTPDLVGAYDKEFRIIAINKACEDYFGIKREDVIGKVYTDVFAAAKGGKGEKDVRRALKGESVHNAVYHSPVTGKYYENFLSPLKDVNGKIYAALVIGHDITEAVTSTELIRKSNDELQKMNKELESFTYIASHDLQEPLRKIQTFADMIVGRENGNLSDAAKDYFRRMQDAARRMQTLILDLLAFSRVSTAERKFETSDLAAIVKAVKEEYGDVIKEKKAVVKIGRMCKAKVIPFQFRQLIQNLLGNSLKFSRSNAKPLICINGSTIKNADPSIGISGPVCHISFSDNGIGFEPEYNEKIFEVFQKLHGRAEYPGTGIGLAIVKKIVSQHNGKVLATSKVGEGTRFDIYLPA